MANRETALQSKRIGRTLIKMGLILFACGAGVVLAGIAFSRFETGISYSWERRVVLGGVLVSLYLGFLPTLLGAALWIVGRWSEKKLNSKIRFR